MPLPLSWPHRSIKTGASSSFWPVAKLQGRKKLPLSLHCRSPGLLPKNLDSFLIHTPSASRQHGTQLIKKMFQLTFYDFLKTICVILQHFSFNPTDRIMFICLKPRICCDYHKTSFGGRHGPLPVFNSGRPPRLVELLSRDGQELELEQEQPHSSPTALACWPRASALAAGNKESFPRQLGAGALKLHICFIPLGSSLCPCKWGFLHFSPTLNECTGTAAAWLVPAKPCGHPWGQGRTPARGTEALQAQPSALCAPAV